MNNQATVRKDNSVRFLIYIIIRKLPHPCSMVSGARHVPEREKVDFLSGLSLQICVFEVCVCVS